MEDSFSHGTLGTKLKAGLGMVYKNKDVKDEVIRV